MAKNKETALIIGGGPAGLTAAYELLRRSDIIPIVVEREAVVGGISKTLHHNGNRMDIGGHRFFSKSDEVMAWWDAMMPSAEAHGIDPETTDRVMLTRNRISRIYFLRRFFAYPISLTLATIRNLGLWRMMRIGASYVWIRLFPIREERSLEDFYINCFGRELYETFFEDYTRKVWGIECSRISPDWGRQRVKGLSISSALLHMMRQMLPKRRSGDIAQKSTETSLIDRFLYPKYGPGQLWEQTAREIEAMGGQVMLGSRVVAIHASEGRIEAVTIRDAAGKERRVEADRFISTMPVRELVEVIDAPVPADVRAVAEGLVYRDFMTAGLLLRRMREPLPDTWIYIQERDVKVGRLQLFNNWSPYMVADPETVWIGMEYFVNEGDELWTMDDKSFIELAVGELEHIGLIDRAELLDAHVARIEKAYPAYFGTYGDFDRVRGWVDGFENLFLVGRNGMHRYNNMDHSMLTAIAAVDNIVAGRSDKSNIWAINTEQEYHEQKEEQSQHSAR